MTPAKTNLLDLDQAGLVAFFASIGEKPFRAQQVMKWIYHQGVVELDGMTNLSRALREKLHAMAEIRLPEIVVDNHSTDGTHKWLMRMDNINSIETVLIPEPERATLCVSSQVGCALECSFCSTAQQGFNRNLSTAEILGQVWQADRIAKAESGGLRRVTNVVMMGMGEPLLNFNNVVTAMNVMTDDWGFGLSKRRVTISTSGVVPALYRLREVSDVSLAVSLHAPFDELRDQLVPVNKKYPLEMLIPACANYIADKPHRSITWEYVMLDGVNDHPEHARMLVKLLKNIPSKVNLIPFNPFPGTDYRRSRPEVIRRFQEILQHSDLVTTIRKTRGDDIDAACGQLVGRVNDKTRRQERRVMPILAV